MTVYIRNPVPAFTAGEITFEDADVFPQLANLGQLPFVLLSSGLLNLDTGTSFPGDKHVFIPFKYRIIAAWINLIELPTGSACIINAGTYSDSGNDNILSHSVATDATLGFADITASIVNAGDYFDGNAGDVIGFKCANSSSANGLAFVSMLALRRGQVGVL